MAKEVIIKTWCDPCLDDGVHTEGEEFTPAFAAGAKPKVIALCGPHRKEFHDPYADLVERLGQAIGSGPKMPKSSGVVEKNKEPCPTCGKAFKNVGVHRARAHGWVPPNGNGGTT